MKIIKRQFDITPFIDERVLKCLKEKKHVRFLCYKSFKFY